MAAMINIRIEQEFGVSSSVDVTYAGIVLRETTLYFEEMLDEQKT